MRWRCVTKPLQVRLDRRWGLPVRNSCTGSSQQSWELSFKEGVPFGASPNFGELPELCTIHLGCTIKHRAAFELFSPRDITWWGQPRASTLSQTTDRQVSGENVAERQRYAGAPGLTSVLHAGAVRAEAVFHKEPPWCRERHDVLLSAGWFSCSPAFV